MINVVAALIWKDNKLLICKRPRHKALPLLWEFPGGKIESGETKFEALKREIKEELDVIIETNDILEETIYHYDNFSVKLTFINAFIINGVPKLLEHEELRWVDVSKLENFEFCPADVEILIKIKIQKEMNNLSNALKQ